MTELFNLAARFTADTSQLVQGVNKARDVMGQGVDAANKLDKTLGKLKTAFAAVVSVAAVAKVAQSVKGLADSVSAAGDRIDKNSQALGMSRKAYQEWDYILGQSGASIDSLGVSMKTLNDAILSGGDGTVTALKTLGLSLKDLKGMSQEDQFEAMVEAFQKMPAGAQKSALAMQMFGRQGQALMPLLNSAPGTVNSLRQDMERMGFVMSDSMVDASVKYGDTLDNLKHTADGLKNTLGYALMEPLTGIFDTITNFFAQESTQQALDAFAVDLNNLGNLVLTGVQNFFQFLTDHQSEIEQVLGNVAKCIGDIVTFIADNSGLILTVLGLYAAFKLFTNPFNIVVAGLAAIAANWPTVKEFFTSKLPDWVNQTFGIDLTQVELPDASEVAQNVSKWWNGEGENGGAKAMVAGYLNWRLSVPGAPSGDPIEELKRWWNGGDGEKGVKDRAIDAIKWVINLPSMPYESGEQLAAAVQEWWDKQVDKVEALISWVLNTPDAPPLFGQNGMIPKLVIWWKQVKRELWKGILDFTLGLFGLPDSDEMVRSIRSWWHNGETGVEDRIQSFLKAQFGIDLPDLEQVVADIRNWWDNTVIPSLGYLFIPSFLRGGEGAPQGLIDAANGEAEGMQDYLPPDFGVPQVNGWDGLPINPEENGSRHFGYHAAGLDYVPTNGYRSVLHEGEAVLSKRDAEAWRNGGTRAATAAEIAAAVDHALEGMSILMDGETVGRLTSKTVSREIARSARAGRFATT